MIPLWKPYAKESIQNPYLMYDRMRAKAPILKAQTGEWILTRYDDVYDLLGNEAFMVGNRLDWIRRQQNYLRDDRVDFQSIVDAMNSFLVLLNPPQHTRIRVLVSEAWSDHNVEDIIEGNITQLTTKLTNEFDLLTDFAMPLPVMTICKIMGIETEDYQKLKGLSEKMVQSLNLYTSLKELVIISEAAATYIAFFKKYITHRKANIGTDLVSKIITKSQNESSPLSEEELISVCIFLFIAGEETTVNLIGNGMLALLENEHIWRQLCEHPSLSQVAIDELLRYEAPVQLVGRIAAEDYRLRNVTFSKGDTITLAIGAANRDPSKFENPHLLQLDRPFKQHLAFGRGKHFCLGSWLAKTQGKLALKALSAQFPTMKRTQQQLQWSNHLALRGIKSLKVRI